jgi:hypothetical protein
VSSTSTTPRETLLLVSIDTEEDNWNRARTGVTVQNIRQLPRLDRLLERLGVRATYFASYQVLINPDAAAVLRDLRDSGRAEIGAHLHPWNTPPIEEPFDEPHSMLGRLPYRLQLAKLRRLTETYVDVMGERPRGFVTGRYALGPGTVRALIECGYACDSSVTPFHSWEDCGGVSHVGAPLNAYRLDGRGDTRVPVPSGPLLEIPVSWGYSRRPWSVWGPVHSALARPALRPLRLTGIASRLNIVKHIALSPEMETVADMLTLSRRLIEDGVRHLQVSFHSPSLVPGLSPFVRCGADRDRLYANIADYVEQVSAATPVTCAAISEAASALDAAWVPPGERERLLA